MAAVGAEDVGHPPLLSLVNLLRKLYAVLHEIWHEAGLTALELHGEAWRPGAEHQPHSALHVLTGHGAAMCLLLPARGLAVGAVLVAAESEDEDVESGALIKECLL